MKAAEHAARTLYADPIDDHEIRHPNHYCWSILLSLLDVVAIMEFSSPLILSQHHMCPLLLSPALHQYMQGPLLSEGGRANGQDEPSL